MQIIRIHRECPHFILATSVNSLPELLARNKADCCFISQLPPLCLRIMLMGSEVDGREAALGDREAVGLVSDSRFG